INTATASNSGTCSAINGGYFEVQPTIDNTGGTISADGSSILYNYGTISGGTISGSAGAKLMGRGTLNNITVTAGSDLLMTSDSNLNYQTLQGTITNNGVIE